jgi:omega-amidase
MKIAYIQSDLIWENPAANIAAFEASIAKANTSADVWVLPEMFTTGFTMAPDRLSETMNGPTIRWMKQQAKKGNFAICGSLIITDNQGYYNRFLFVKPDGTVDFYDKRHLFTLAGEHQVYQPGREKKIITYKGVKFCLQVCYDLRFPVFSRNVEDYDVLLYVANWPKPRISAWDALLKARAIENMCMVVGVNRLGTDAKGYEYVGHSQVVDALGNYVLPPTETSGVFIADVDIQAIYNLRNTLRFLEDRDYFLLQD